MRANEEQQGIINAAAVTTWNEMNDNERFGVRVGLFPYAIMEKHDPKFEGVDSQSFAVALMAVAKANGGMLA